MFYVVNLFVLLQRAIFVQANRTSHQNKAWFGPAAFTCSSTFDGTFGLRRQHCCTLTRKTRLGHSKKGLARKTYPNKRVNEETDSRRVEEKETNLRRRIKRGESRKTRRGMEEEEEEKMSRQCPLCICWVSPRASVMLYADPLSKVATRLPIQLFSHLVWVLFLSLLCDVLTL